MWLWTFWYVLYYWSIMTIIVFILVDGSNFLPFLLLLMLIPVGVSGKATIFLFGIFIWFSDKKLSLGGFVPSGSPWVLSIFLIIIELISYFVRPLAMVLRITINLLCGHLLLVVFRPVVFAILPLEIMVCIVQPYVYFLIIRI